MNDRLVSRAVLAATTTAVLAVVADAPPWLRVPAVMLFVGLCPGVAWARRFRVDDAGDLAALGVAVSLALAALAATPMALAAAWSPPAALAILVAVTLLGLLPVGARKTSAP